ncbi:MAG: PHP domain-containing protein [Bacillota bacterium]
MKADLHIHTTASDGYFTPEEIIKKAKDKGLKAISITDHDTVEGLERGFQEAEALHNIIVIPGIEISTNFDDTELHVLGYYIDFNNSKFKKKLHELRQEREERNERIIAKLNKLGIKISMDDVRKVVKEGTMGRPHIAQAICNLGVVGNPQKAFDKYLLKGSPAYVSRKKLRPCEAIDLIKEAQGLPVLAHPIFLRDKLQILKALKMGFVGVEVEYPAHSSEFKLWLQDKADRLNLIATGGSDYHGEYKGDEIGECTVDITIVQKLQWLKGEECREIF